MYLLFTWKTLQREREGMRETRLPSTGSHGCNCQIRELLLPSLPCGSRGQRTWDIFFAALQGISRKLDQKLNSWDLNWLLCEMPLLHRAALPGIAQLAPRIFTCNINIFWLASILLFRVSLSEAHARLNLRNKVLKEDVLIAALLFETSLTLKYGNVFSY